MKCYNCGNGNLQEYQQTCPDCGAFVHCCMNCKFYDQYAQNQCKIYGKYEPNKKQENHCDDFKPNESFF